VNRFLSIDTKRTLVALCHGRQKDDFLGGQWIFPRVAKDFSRGNKNCDIACYQLETKKTFDKKNVKFQNPGGPRPPCLLQGPPASPSNCQDFSSSSTYWCIGDIGINVFTFPK